MGAVFLQEETQVEQRLLQDGRLVQQQRDEEAADSPVAVEEGMDGFELRVGERSLQRTASLRT